MNQLAKRNELQAALAKADTIEAKMDLHARLGSVSSYLPKIGASLEQQNDVAEARLVLERQVGEILAEVERSPGGYPGSFQLGTSFQAFLKQHDISRTNAHRWQLEASVSLEAFEAWLDKMRMSKQEITSAGLQKLAKGKTDRGASLCDPAHPSPYSSDDWGTPRDLFDLLHKEFGFSVDVCCHHETALLPRHWTPAEDALAQDWSGDICWMNPPYSRTGRWMEKAHNEAVAGATVVCLIPVDTSTDWWWDQAAKGEIRFLRGRLKFTNPATGLPEFPARFASAVVVFRPGVHGEDAMIYHWEGWGK